MVEPMRPEDLPADLVDAAARARSPHLWDGTFRNVLLRFKSIAKHTPEQADAAIEKKRQEKRDDARVYLAAALPAYGATVLEEAAAALDVDPDYGMGSSAQDVAVEWIRTRAARLRDDDHGEADPGLLLILIGAAVAILAGAGVLAAVTGLLSG